jgi:hypothetical protein
MEHIERDKTMRRLALAAATGLTLALAPVGAAHAQPASADVNIEPNAQYDILGSILHVELKVTCDGGAGGVVVDVTQSAPETEYLPPETEPPPPPVAYGSGPRSVLCDGKAHEVAVTIFGEGFDAGKALATATLTVVDPLADKTVAADTDERIIDIRVV